VDDFLAFDGPPHCPDQVLPTEIGPQFELEFGTRLPPHDGEWLAMRHLHHQATRRFVMRRVSS